jgi:predicted nucleic acid-binding protein
MKSLCVDTNVLLSIASEYAYPPCPAAQALSAAIASGCRIAISAQSLYEFWSVATRPPASNGFGWDIEKTRETLDALCWKFALLEEKPEVVGIWLDLVTRFRLKGKRIHDAHLLATIKANGVPTLLTLNPRDFPDGSGIEIVTPAE